LNAFSRPLLVQRTKSPAGRGYQMNRRKPSRCSRPCAETSVFHTRQRPRTSAAIGTPLAAHRRCRTPSPPRPVV